MSAPEPQRRFQVKIDIGADDIKSLRYAVGRIYEWMNTEPLGKSLVSGGYDSGYWIEVRENLSQDHDQYVRELNSWLEEKQGEGKHD